MTAKVKYTDIYPQSLRELLGLGRLRRVRLIQKGPLERKSSTVDPNQHLSTETHYSYRIQKGVLAWENYERIPLLNIKGEMLQM